MKEKKGLSPVIATVLLIAMVIVIGIIVFIWMKGSIQEVIYKFGDQNIELACDSVAFEAEYYSDVNSIYVINNGDVPIKDFKVQAVDKGNKYTFNLGEKSLLSGGLFTGITSGQGEEVGIGGEDDDLSTSDKLIIIPILEGRTSQGESKNYVCDERYGMEVTI